VFVNY
jgi:hydrocephalus-inducing protein